VLFARKSHNQYATLHTTADIVTTKSYDQLSIYNSHTTASREAEAASKKVCVKLKADIDTADAAAAAAHSARDVALNTTAVMRVCVTDAERQRAESRRITEDVHALNATLTGEVRVIYMYFVSFCFCFVSVRRVDALQRTCMHGTLH
jgi:hypothetical protein